MPCWPQLPGTLSRRPGACAASWASHASGGVDRPSLLAAGQRRQLVPCSPGLSSSLLTSPSHCRRPPGISATRPPCSSPSSSQQHLHVFRPKHRRLPRLCSSPHPLTSICRTVLALSSKPVLHLSLFPSLSAPQLWLSPGDRRSPRTGLLACLPAPFSSVSTQQPEINHNNNVLWCHSPG